MGKQGAWVGCVQAGGKEERRVVQRDGYGSCVGGELSVGWAAWQYVIDAKFLNSRQRTRIENSDQLFLIRISFAFVLNR